jgi:hypothetical protein
MDFAIEPINVPQRANGPQSGGRQDNERDWQYRISTQRHCGHRHGR